MNNVLEAPITKTKTPSPTPKKTGKNWGLIFCVIALFLGCLWMATRDEDDPTKLIMFQAGTLSEKQIATLVRVCEAGNYLACEYLQANGKILLHTNFKAKLWSEIGNKKRLSETVAKFANSYDGFSVIEFLSLSFEEFSGGKVSAKDHQQLIEKIAKSFSISEETVTCLQETRKKILARNLGYDQAPYLEQDKYSYLKIKVEEELGLSSSEVKSLRFKDLFYPNFFHNHKVEKNIKYNKPNLKPLLKELMLFELKKCI